LNFSVGVLVNGCGSGSADLDEAVLVVVLRVEAPVLGFDRRA